MTGRLLLGLALLANILVVVICTAETAQASAASSASASSSGSTAQASSSSSAKASSNSKKPVNCRRVIKCPKNEEYSYCPQTLQRAQYCSEKGQLYRRPSNVAPCKEGCVCKKDYLRAENGTCIPEKQCTITCGPDEVLENCPADCEADFCPTYEITETCDTPDVCPPPACKCGFNRRRALNGSCIMTTSCPPFPCDGSNEIYDPCPPICPTDDCSQASPSGECPKQFGRIGIILPCNPKCRCIEGYWRLNGVCVPYGQCPGVCPDKERYSECIQAECRALNCTQRDKPVPCVRMDPRYCIKGCVCQEGYLRAENGICVEENQCDTPVCPPNEEMSQCAQATCRAQNCTQKGQPIACPLIAEGYCIKACVCKENFLRDQYGNCIPDDQCPTQLTCGENEVLDNCSTSCNTDNCPQSADEEKVCFQSEPCQPACKCAFNFRRSVDGICIPTDSCPAFDCGARPFEKYVACPPICPSDACGKPRLTGRCPYRIGIRLECNPKCQCMDGYGRNDDGICVPFEECPNLCPQYEEYSSCVENVCRPQNCSNRDLHMESCPAQDEESCHRGCVCQKGYFRNENGTCISYEECGGPMCPNANEEFQPKTKACPPNTCDALVSKFKCDEDQPEVPGCVCVTGFLRQNVTSPCIKICECTQMSGSSQCQKTMIDN